MGTILAAILLLQETWGIELGYRVNAPPEERAKVAKEIVDILRKRLDAADLKRCTLAVDADGLLRVHFPGGTPEDVAKAKPLLGRRGQLELRLTADRTTQEKYVKDGVVPEGWEAVQNPSPRPDYAAWGGRMLVRKRSAIEGGRIVSAEARRQLLPGPVQDGYISFQLDPVGARLFDEAAAILSAQRPPGLLAILLDGIVMITPAVMTDKFGGAGQITGTGGERETKNLAIVLSHGALPVPLGEPEFERFFK